MEFQDSEERRPLLAPNRPRTRSVAKRTPLPYGQLALLCLVRFVDPVVFTFVFPFMNQMMADLRPTNSASDNAFYAGLVDGLFALAQFTTAFYWGSLSDKIGRRPVLFISLASCLFAVLFFGLSRSLVSIIFLRAIAGIMLSNNAVIQSILGEITDSTNVAQAVPLTAITWGLGCVLGPLVGSLHHPTVLMPSIFGQSGFWLTYPYFLPCFIVVVLIVLAFVLSFLFMRESLPTQVREHLVPKDKIESYGAVTVGPVKLPINSPSCCKLPFTALCIASVPAIRSVLTCAFILNVLCTSYDITFILMSSTPVAAGGLGRSATQTSYALGGGALFSIVVLPVIFAPIQHALGTKRMYSYLMLIWPLTYISLPLLNVLARTTTLPNGHLSIAGQIGMWVGIAILVAIPRLATMNLSLHILLLKNAAPSPTVLGSTFGLSQTVSCMARAMTPAFASSLFAYTFSGHLLGGLGVWVILSGLGLVGVLAATRLRDDSDSISEPSD